MSNELPRTRHTVDVHDVITGVCDDWLRFARENGAAHLTARAVTGRSLYEFIEGEETRRIYRMLLAKVRRHRPGITIPLRCDGPELRRSIELDIEPRERGGIGFVSRVVRIRKRRFVRLLDAGQRRSPESITICDWCKRIPVGREWVEVEEGVSRLDLFDSVELPDLEYAVCEDCGERLEREAMD